MLPLALRAAASMPRPALLRSAAPLTALARSLRTGPGLVGPAPPARLLHASLLARDSRKEPAQGASEQKQERSETTSESSDSAAQAHAHAHAPPPGEDAAPPPRKGLFDLDTSTSLIESIPEEQGGGRTGARRKGEAPSTMERNRKFRARLAMGASVLGIAYGAYVFSLPLDEQEQERFRNNNLAPWQMESWYGRLYTRLTTMKKDVQAPMWEKLLPDPLPFPYGRPYTLVVDLDGLLTSSWWTREHGWRTAKRPGLDYFLGYLSQFYEIVLYTTQPFFTVAPIIEKLDPDRRFLTYLLFRESCRTLDDGRLIKDLEALNRDPAKVIFLDVEAEPISEAQDNSIIVKKWNGERGDRELIGFIPFLEAVGIYNIPDVRRTIKAYEGTHIPTEHLSRTNEMRAAAYKSWLEKQDKKKHSPFAFLTMSAQKDDTFKTWYDTERERYQAAYEADEKFWRENGEKIRQQAKEEQDKQIEEFKSNALATLTGGFFSKPTEQGQQSSGQAQPSQ